MAQSFTPGLKISSNVSVTKLRELPVPGEILFKEGDRVKADDIVARAFLPGELHILRIAEKMGVEPFEVIRGLKVVVGEAVDATTLLCEHAGLFGLFKSRFFSPVEGVIELINEQTGHVAVRGPSRPIMVKAYIPGRVKSVSPGKSVVIESEAAMVQGIFGVGGERRGELKVLPVPNDKSLLPSDLPEKLKGLVVVGGTNPSLETIQHAANSGAAGLVVGSIDDQALAGYLGFEIGIALTGDEDIPMTLIATEGFGNISISERVISLLQKFDGKSASINGATQVRAGALRPEIVIDLDVQQTAMSKPESIKEQEGLYPGREIRIIRVPFFGKRAVVKSLPSETQKIETGAYCRVLEAQLEDGSLVTVPRANVEVV